MTQQVLFSKGLVNANMALFACILLLTMYLLLKSRQAFTGRLGRPQKLTGRQTRPQKKAGRHRQARKDVGL